MESEGPEARTGTHLGPNVRKHMLHAALLVSGCVGDAMIGVPS
ncbi:hypothetical protein QO015_003823 [Kaistia geumhonensis]|uniref:MFS transporter n=1 Tax=Kaistia geumhonensis TaxID=410839 RepID=A0ABU0MB68_9HYPH|nr:hypothetical protein [Kaistia geumhonensis]